MNGYPAGAHDRNHHPSQATQRAASKPAKITGTAIVKAAKPGRYRTRTEPSPDAEADARVAAFFARMGIKPPA